MKLRYIVLLIVIFFPVARSQSQISRQDIGSVKSVIEYQSPMNGDIHVTQRTTLIIRPTKEIMSSRSDKDFVFSVIGELSGVHTGKVVISDDNQTVIFKPDHPFAVNEKVSVRLEISGIENISPVSYNFRITSMSEEERIQALVTLSEREQAENEAAMQESAETIEAATLPMGADTITGLPITAVKDTVTTHEEGNIFFSPTGRTPLFYSFLAIISDTGSSALFERDIPLGCGNFRMQPDGTVTFFRQLFNAPIGGVFFGRIDRLDQHMKVLDTFQCGNGFIADLHDFQLLSNGHAILIAYDPERVNTRDTLLAQKDPKDSILALKALTSEIVIGAIIQELDNQKNVVFQWRSWDHFHITDATRDIHLVPSSKGDTLIDYMHINTAISDSKDGNIIASFRHCDEVSKIDRNTGAFIWRWGGKHNMFTFSGPNPTDTLQFSHQHDPERILNGHITLWDNGNLHTKIVADTIATVPSSRAVEYILDEVSFKATVVWEYDSLPFSAAAGNVQRLPGGNTLIGLGTSVHPNAVEVTPDGNKIFQLSFQTGAFSYRVYRFPFIPLLVRQIGSANSFGLSSIYPNPAQNQTTVSFTVKDPGMMQVDLLDVLGHTVHSIREKLSAAGAYTADIDVHELPTGTYYCKLSQNGNTMMKMVVVEK